MIDRHTRKCSSKHIIFDTFENYLSGNYVFLHFTRIFTIINTFYYNNLSDVKNIINFHILTLQIL